jgi:hypothetical protein
MAARARGCCIRAPTGASRQIRGPGQLETVPLFAPVMTDGAAGKCAECSQLHSGDGRCAVVRQVAWIANSCLALGTPFAVGHASAHEENTHQAKADVCTAQCATFSGSVSSSTSDGIVEAGDQLIWNALCDRVATGAGYGDSDSVCTHERATRDSCVRRPIPDSDGGASSDVTQALARCGRSETAQHDKRDAEGS